jgi:hypothetical protein
MFHLDWRFFPVFDLLDPATRAELAAAQNGLHELVGAEHV